MAIYTLTETQADVAREAIETLAALRSTRMGLGASEWEAVLYEVELDALRALEKK